MIRRNPKQPALVGRLSGFFFFVSSPVGLFFFLSAGRYSRSGNPALHLTTSVHRHLIFVPEDFNGWGKKNKKKTSHSEIQDIFKKTKTKE